MGSITHIIKDAVKRKLAEECSASDMDGAAQDENGQDVSRACVVNRYEYDAFGNTVTCEETVPNRFRFAGEQYDQITQQYYLRARFYNPVIGRFLQEDDYYGDGLNLYAYCRNNPVSYVDPSGHGTESAPDKWAENNRKDIQDLVDEINHGSGASPGDMEAIKSLAEEFGLDPSKFDVKSSKEVNQQALKDLVDEVNQAGGASPSDQKILKEFAEEYGMDYDSLGVKEAGGSSTSGSGEKVCADYAKNATMNPSSSEVVLGKFNQDGVSYVEIAEQRGATYFQLDNWDEVVKTVGEENIWNINEQFLSQQVDQGKEFILFHDPNKASGYYAKEVQFLIDSGYKFIKDGNIWKAIR